MKLLIVAPYFFEPHRWMISAYKTALFLSKQMEVVVLTTGRPAYEQLNPHLSVYRLRDWFLPDPVNYSIVPGLFRHVWRIVRREKPDVVVVNKHMFFTSLSVWLLRLMKQKVIVTTDTFPGMNWHPRHPLVRVVMTIYAYLIGWPVLKAAHQVVLFHEDLLPLARRLGLRVQVIHNGVDVAAIDTARPAMDIAKSPGQVFVCYIGRMETIKGYNDFLAAAKLLSPRYSNVVFYFIGSYHGKGDWVKAEQSPQIVFLGHRSDIAGLLKHMDIFVLPSYSEGLPNALMEAMAAGLACVSSRVGGVKVLIEEGESGLTYAAGDIHDLEQQLERVISDGQLRQRLGQNARRRIAQDFDWAVIAKQYLSLFKSVLTEKP